MFIWQNTNRTKSVTFFLLLALLGFYANSSLAAVTELQMFTLNDGTGPFTDNNPGNDGGANNQVIRTNDTLVYRAVFVTSGGDTGVTGTFTFPFITGSAIAGDNGVTPAATWNQVPPQCLGAGSSLSADARVVTCALGDLPAPSTVAIDLIATVSGRSPNAQEIDFAGPLDGVGTANATSVETGVGVDANYYDTDVIGGVPQQGVIAADGRLDQLVSAAPRFDLMLGDVLGGMTAGLGGIAHAFNGEAGPANEDGLSLAYGVFMFARDNKGSEMLDPAQPISFTYTLAGSGTNPLPPAAINAMQLITWTGPFGDQEQNLNPGCSNGSLNNFFTPRDTGPSNSVSASAVANGGALSCSQASAGDDVVMTIAGDGNFDTSLNHVPTLLRIGGGTNPVDLDEWYVMSKRGGGFY